MIVSVNTYLLLKLTNKLKDMGEGKISTEKGIFQTMQDNFLVQEKKILNNFKSKMFLIKNLDRIPTSKKLYLTQRPEQQYLIEL